MAEESGKRDTGSRRRLFVGGALLLVALLVARAVDLPEMLRGALVWIRDLGPLGALLFVALYAVGTVLFFPALLLTLGAGAVFGVLQGTVLVFFAATLGATLAFLVGRYLARDLVARRIAGNAKFAAIDEAVAREGWKIVALSRLTPIFPFVLLNYAFGLTKVPLRHYVPASAIGMIPGTVMYVYLGSVAGTLATAGGERARTPAEWALYVVGLLATVAVAVFVTRLASRAIEQRGVTEVNGSTGGTR
jgi:uncharacterized membrane protein YdjX (TVP38/TMEM64 family)